MLDTSLAFEVDRMLGPLTKILKGILDLPITKPALMAGTIALDPSLLLLCVASGIATTAEIIEQLRQGQSTAELRNWLVQQRAGQQLAGDLIAEVEGIDISDLPPDDVRRFQLIMHRFLSGEFDDATADRAQIRSALQENRAAIDQFFMEDAAAKSRLIEMQLQLQLITETTFEEVQALGDDVQRLQARFNEITNAPPLEFLPTANTGNRFVYRQRRVELHGRDKELQSLRDFLAFTPGIDAVADCRWWLWTGPGGIGKSRLAWELCLEAESFGWNVGFLRDRPFDDWWIKRPTLIVVDYVAQRPQEIAEIILSFTGERHRMQEPLRILLLERTADEAKDDWTRRFIPSGSRRGDLFQFAWDPEQRGDFRHLAPYVHDVAPLSNDALWLTMNAVWNDFDGNGSPPERPEREDCLHAMATIDPAKRPLFAALAAEAIATRGVSTIRQWRNPQVVAQLILEGEFDRWKRACRADWDELGESGDFRREFESHLNLVHFATLVGRQPLEAVEWLRERDDELWLPVEVRTSWLRVITGYTIDDGTNTIPPLEPDLLGELLVLERFASRLSHDSRTDELGRQVRRIRNLVWRMQPMRTAAFLNRAATDFPVHDALGDLLVVPCDPLNPPEARPTEWAGAYLNLGNTFADRTTGDRSGNLAQAVACYEMSVRVYTEENHPDAWSQVQNNLGTVYLEMPTGNPVENPLRAISHLDAALRKRSKQDRPAAWAETQTNLGGAYAQLITGDREENLRQSIAYSEAALEVRTERDFPPQWALTQLNLGAAYIKLPAGEEDENRWKAIEHSKASLRVFTKENSPVRWGSAHNNIGGAYSLLMTGDHEENRRMTIHHCEEALGVLSEDEFPQQWAMVKCTLGVAYIFLPASNPEENLRTAIEHLNDALRVHSEEAFPIAWATTHRNLAEAYLRLPNERDAENVQLAIKSLQSAMRVRTMVNFPTLWAGDQSLLGAAYTRMVRDYENLTTSDRGDELRTAFACFEAALSVQTEGDAPKEWENTAASFARAEMTAAQKWRPQWSKYGWDREALWQSAEQRLIRAIAVCEQIGDQHHTEQHSRTLEFLRRNWESGR